jgi:hypothetical protein
VSQVPHFIRFILISLFITAEIKMLSADEVGQVETGYSQLDIIPPCLSEVKGVHLSYHFRRDGRRREEGQMTLFFHCFNRKDDASKQLLITDIIVFVFTNCVSLLALIIYAHVISVVTNMYRNYGTPKWTFLFWVTNM